MPTHALFVDLPNFYSRLLKSGIDEERELRGYFLYWLDFDRLAAKLTGAPCSVWVFYSGKRIGPSSYRIKDAYLEEYIARINSLRGVTARDANIDGKQREPASYKCPQCSYEGLAEWESEKGIDASLTVHLFDTMESWDVAHLLSGDADFVPTVASLRRRGKVVLGAGFVDASPALKRECFDYVDLPTEFLKEDVAAYRLFRSDGFAQQWLMDEVELLPEVKNPPARLQFSLACQPNLGTQNRDALSQVANPEQIIWDVYLTSDIRLISVPGRQELIKELEERSPSFEQISDSPTQMMYKIRINPFVWSGVQRRLDQFTASLRNVTQYETSKQGTGYSTAFQYDRNTGDYTATHP